MYLESITDQQFLDLGQERQVEIFARHCTGIENRIRQAHSRKEAEEIMGNACGKLQEECINTIVQGALVRRTHELVEQYWGTAEKE